MIYNPKAIANALLDIAREHNSQLSPMKLQKLVYFAHGWNLAITDDPLINEVVEAWKFGPVIRSLYHHFKHLGNGPIDERAVTRDVRRDGSNWKFHVHTPEISDHENAEFTKALLDKIWEVYGGLSAVQLSKMTHQNGTPWHQIWEPMKDNPIKGTDIPNPLIRDWFREQAAST